MGRVKGGRIGPISTVEREETQSTSINDPFFGGERKGEGEGGHSQTSIYPDVVTTYIYI